MGHNLEVKPVANSLFDYTIEKHGVTVATLRYENSIFTAKLKESGLLLEAETKDMILSKVHYILSTTASTTPDTTLVRAKITYQLMRLINGSMSNIMDEIQMSFNSRARTTIEHEGYVRNRDEMTVTLEVVGHTGKIADAIKETRWMFEHYCDSMHHEVEWMGDDLDAPDTK